MANPQRYAHGAMSSPDAPNSPNALEEIAGDAQKYTKDEAVYRPSGSSQTRCGNCVHFTSSAFAGGVCALVAGDILPDAVCDLWEGAPPSLGDLVT
jgi:hypothetical protein